LGKIVRFDEKIAIVVAAGFPIESTADWFQKYRIHLQGARERNHGTDLTFAQYLAKVIIAGISEPAQIGRMRDQFVLGRIGDVGRYTDGNCRFITAVQNHRERFENGRHLQYVDSLKGANKENSEHYRKISEILSGRTKETHSGYAAVSQARSKNFVLTDPNGVEHRGSNLKEFCEANGLNVFGIYNVFADRRPHYKGWTGYYVK
jgi:hypothetical protein